LPGCLVEASRLGLRRGFGLNSAGSDQRQALPPRPCRTLCIPCEATGRPLARVRHHHTPVACRGSPPWRTHRRPGTTTEMQR
jgi:hypothetical protein